jgi:hypothetical protein
MSGQRKPDALLDMSCDLSGSADDVIAELAWIAKIGDLPAIKVVVCTENLIRVDDVMESPKLTE